MSDFWVEVDLWLVRELNDPLTALAHSKGLSRSELITELIKHHIIESGVSGMTFTQAKKELRQRRIASEDL